MPSAAGVHEAAWEGEQLAAQRRGGCAVQVRAGELTDDPAEVVGRANMLAGSRGVDSRPPHLSARGPFKSMSHPGSTAKTSMLATLKGCRGTSSKLPNRKLNDRAVRNNQSVAVGA